MVGGIAGGAIVNKITGISKMKFSNRMFTYFVFAVASEVLLRFKNSSEIFYKIGKLPKEEL